LASRLPCAINVKDDPGVSRSIYQPSGLLVVGDRTTQKVIEKQRAQRFDGRFGQGCLKTREGRASWEMVTFKQRHERFRKGLEPLVKLLQRAFPTDGVPEQDREKIDHPRLARNAAAQSAPVR